MMFSLEVGSTPPVGRAAFFILALVLAVMVSGCDISVFDEKNIPEGPDRFVRGYIELLRKGDIEAAATHLAPQLRTPEALEGLAKMAGDLAGGKLKSIRVVQYSHTKDIFEDETQSKLAYELSIGSRWALVEAVVDGDSGRYSVVAFYVEPRELSRKQRNTFSLSGKDKRQYAVLALSVLVPAFILWVAYLCLKSGLRRRWLWLVFILFGFGGYYVNWTSGEWWFRLFSFSLLGTAVSRNGLDGPWVVSFYVPIGAVIFYLRHTGKRRASRGLFGPPVEQPPAGHSDPE